MADGTRTALRREGFDDGRVQRVADLRYAGQAYEVGVDGPEGAVTRPWADSVVARFHAAHRARYGYDFRGRPDQPVEWVNLRTVGTGPVPRPEIPEIISGTGTPAVVGSRRVRFDGWLDAVVHDRAVLRAGDVIAGPAIVQEFGSTVPVHPGFRATVDRFGNLLLEMA